MAIDKIFKSTNLDDVADNILSEVDDFVFSVDKMQQRKVAGNVQKVVQAFRQIETELQKRYDNVTDVLEKRITSINDGRDGLNGIDGRSGRDGKPGRDGVNGKQGPPGTPGKDGIDGVNGVSVTNANIDFDGSLVISLSTGEQINVGEVVPPELERQLVELRQGGSAGSSGDVMGPTSSTDNAIARFDGTTGKLVQNSVVTIADTTGNMTGVGTFNATGLATLTAGAVVQGLTVGLGAGAVVGNTAVGLGALGANTSGGLNTAVGASAGAAITTGNYLTAVGRDALLSATGDANTGIGVYAGRATTTGTLNSALGYFSLKDNISGSYNTALGSQALQSNTTASYNTAVGYLAGYSNTTAASNTFLGQQAGYSATTSSHNTVIGTGAGFSLTTGAFAWNVLVGTTAGRSLTTGAANTFVGGNSTAQLGAGYYVTTGSANVILGGYSGSTAPISATGSNFVVLSDGDGNIVASTKTAQTFALPGGTLSSGTGIAFPATQSASSDANTLDDYEEGTFTATLKGSTTDPTIAVTTTATYTKVGRLVYVDINFENVDTTGAAGDVTVTGLPFTSSNIRYTGSALSYLFDLNTGTSLSAFLLGQSTTVVFLSSKTLSDWQALKHSAGVSRFLITSFSYNV